MTNRFLILGVATALLATVAPGYAQVTGVNTPPSSNQPLYLGTNGNVDMVIDVNGNVGIGIGSQSPDASLEVANTGIARDLYLESSDSDYAIPITFLNQSVTCANGGQWGFGINGASPVTFATMPAGSFWIHEDCGGARMVITNGGKVGIGLASPQAALDVNGGMRGSNASIVTGQACSTEGMLAYDMTNHQPVYCNSSSVWSAFASNVGPFGGFYQIVGSNGNPWSGSCGVANPYTGGCSCPSWAPNATGGGVNFGGGSVNTGLAFCY